MLYTKIPAKGAASHLVFSKKYKILSFSKNLIFLSIKVRIIDYVKIMELKSGAINGMMIGKRDKGEFVWNILN